MRQNENTWFAHDCFDSQSPMMTMMCIKYKMQGYGMWWKLMEIFRTENDYRIKINKPFFYTALAIQMMCSEKKLHEYLADLVSYTLLQTNGEYLWCDGFLERMRFMEQKKEKLRAAGKKGGDTTKQNRLAAKAQTSSDTNTLPQQNSSDAAPPLQHFAAHNTTEHNITLHNIT